MFLTLVGFLSVTHRSPPRLSHDDVGQDERYNVVLVAKKTALLASQRAYATAIRKLDMVHPLVPIFNTSTPAKFVTMNSSTSTSPQVRSPFASGKPSRARYRDVAKQSFPLGRSPVTKYRHAFRRTARAPTANLQALPSMWPPRLAMLSAICAAGGAHRG